MSTNLATILVGLGYDLSALEKGAPEAFRMINQQTTGMSAEMKRNAREGAEAFRSIDEMIGIHINRPMTRLLVETFPRFGKALSEIIGGVAFGAVAFAGFELFDRIEKGIERAQKAQEEFAASGKKVQTVFDDALQSYEKADKLRSLSGVSLELFKIDTASIDEARKKIDALTAAVADMQKKEEAASGFFTRIGAWIGDTAHTLYNTPTELSAERITKQTEQFAERFNELSKLDALKGTNESAKFVADQLTIAQAKLTEMSSHPMGWFQTLLRNQIPTTQTGQLGFSQQEIDRMKEYVDLLKQANGLVDASAKDRSAQDAQARAKAAAEAQRKSIAELQGDLKRWNDAANENWQTWMKINAEVESLVPKLGEVALSERASQTSRARQMFFPDFAVAPPPGAPMLKDQAELQSVTESQTESWKKAGEVLQQIESPTQKYAAQLAILKELESQGRINADQFAQAQQVLADQLVVSETRIQGMERALERLLETSNTVGAGIKAFYMQLQIEASDTAKFTFDFMSSGMKGLEDTFVRSLNVMGANHRERMLEMRRLWNEFFISIDEKLLKFSMNKMFATLLQGIGHTSFGKEIGSFMTQGSDVTKGATELANTSALTLNTAAVVANTAAMTTSGVAAAAGGGTAGGGGMMSLFDLGIPAFASGTDFAPGGMSLVGENGPELVNLPAGSSVTPNSSFRSGGGVTIHNHIDAKGAEIGVEAKIAHALQQSLPAVVVRAVVESAERTRRSLSSQ